MSAARPRVFVTRCLPGRALEYLAEYCETAVWPGELPPSPEELVAEAARAEGLLTLLTDRVDAALLAAAPRLRAVSNMATGVDNIDLAAATARGVIVTRTPGVLSGTTADFTFALMLAAARRLAEGERMVREGRWRTWGPEVLLGRDVHGATLGIVGMGGIGREVARRAQAFAMRILYTSRSRKPDVEAECGARFVALDELLRESDFVTLHAPLTEETWRLIGEQELRMMKPTAFLINTARGGLVDPAALERALREGWIAGAALDVTEPEPLPAGHPLLSAPNLIVTPHIASASVATRSRMAMLAGEQLVQALSGGTPAYVANPEVLGRLR